jgi:hypothetical protein
LHGDEHDDVQEGVSKEALAARADLEREMRVSL